MKLDISDTLAAAIAVFAIVVFALAAVALVSLPAAALMFFVFNGVSEMFGGPTISFWLAWGLSFLLTGLFRTVVSVEKSK